MKIELYHTKPYEWGEPDIELITLEGNSWEDSKKELQAIYKVSHDGAVNTNRLHHKLNNIYRDIEWARKGINDTKRKKSSLMKTVDALGLSDNIKDNPIIKSLNKNIGDIGEQLHELNMKNIATQGELDKVVSEQETGSLRGYLLAEFDDYINTEEGSAWAYNYLLGHGWKVSSPEVIRINKNWRED